MGLLKKRFFDKYGNFNNEKFIQLIKEAKKQKAKKSKKQSSLANKEISLFNSVSKKDVWRFINKLNIFLSSGIDIKGALNILAKQTKIPFLKKIIIEMKNNLTRGISIHETMLSYPKVFDNLTVSLIKVGEKTGKLSQILNELDQSMLESLELKGKVKGAMIYPMILLLLTIGMVTFMMMFIVPKVTDGFKKAGAQLPKPTQIVVNISEFLGGFTYNDEFVKYNSDGTCSFKKISYKRNKDNPYKKEKIIGEKLYFGKKVDKGEKKGCHVSSQAYKIIIILLAIIVIFKLLKKTYFGRLMFSKIAIRLPIFGYIVKQSNIIYFIKSFTLLINSGVLLLDSLKISSQVVGNLAYKKELIRIKNEVEIGLTMSKSLGLNLDYENAIYLNKFFSEEFAYVVNTGEETGTLADSLKKIGENYNKELKRYIGNLSSMMEPIIIILVGALVGGIIISIMLPFFEMGKVAKNL